MTNPPAETARDEERFTQWWSASPAWSPEEMAIIHGAQGNLGPMKCAFLAALHSERERTREMIAKIKSLPPLLHETDYRGCGVEDCRGMAYVPEDNPRPNATTYLDRDDVLAILKGYSNG